MGKTPPIVIDIYKIKDMGSGLGMFSKGFAEAILENSMAEQHELHFIVPSQQKWLKHNQTIDSVQSRYIPFTNPDASIWHSLYQFPSHLPGKKSKWILTIHDLNFIIEKSPQKADRYRRKLQKIATKADIITTVSEFSRNMIVEYLKIPSREIITIPNGVEPLHPVTEKPVWMPDDHFFFAIGAVNRKKNFHTLLPLLQAKTDHYLVIAGDDSTDYAAEIRLQAKDLKVSERVLMPGKITEEEKSWLFRNCEVFVFPSLAEGFGLPLIEAMNAGKPIVCSSIGSLKEIGRDFPLYLENFDSDHLIEKTILAQESFSEDKKKAEIRHSESFGWKDTIAKYVDLYNSLL